LLKLGLQELHTHGWHLGRNRKAPFTQNENENENENKNKNKNKKNI
jgi:hypothetical protein